MTIRQISLNDFRNLKSTTLNLHPKLNILSGLNASGKTSFLEAVHIICQGRSFKTHLLNQCIQNNKNNFLIFSKFDNYKAGISRNFKQTIIRIDNQNIHRVSTLAKNTPVKIINNSTFDLILGSPGVRRDYIDWCLFHVEHNYLKLSLEFKHVLKQRNALLKHKKNISELDYWDEYFSKLCSKIYQLRLEYIQRLQIVLNHEFSDALNSVPINLVYKPGWNTEGNILDTLKRERLRDLKYGFTRYGVHRDDINLCSNGVSIQNYFSRGEIKKVSIFLLLTQLHLLNQNSNKKIILLIDDLESELDQNSIDYVLNKLSKLELQLFITSISSSTDLIKHHEEYRLFHVEHGMIKAVNNT